jgi:hypothetical protein
VTLRNRVSVAAALGVLVVVAAVSGVLYLSYAASVHSRVDPALVDAAQQAAGIAQRVKQSAATEKRGGNGTCCVQRGVASVGSGRSAGHMASESSLNAVASRSGGGTSVAIS